MDIAGPTEPTLCSFTFGGKWLHGRPSTGTCHYFGWGGGLWSRFTWRSWTPVLLTPRERIPTNVSALVTGSETKDPGWASASHPSQREVSKKATRPKSCADKSGRTFHRPGHSLSSSSLGFTLRRSPTVLGVTAMAQLPGRDRSAGHAPPPACHRASPLLSPLCLEGSSSSVGSDGS